MGRRSQGRCAAIQTTSKWPWAWNDLGAEFNSRLSLNTGVPSIPLDFPSASMAIVPRRKHTAPWAYKDQRVLAAAGPPATSNAVPSYVKSERLGQMACFLRWPQRRSEPMLRG